MSRSPIDDIHLTLLGGFELRSHGDRVCLPLGTCRLLSYLALQECGAPRHVVAEALWPHRPAGRAAANLRSTLWHARSLGRTALIASLDGRIQLSPQVRVDLCEASRWAHEITDAPGSTHRLDEHDKILAALARELLPDWIDDWLLFERERWDQVRLHALEVLAHRMIAAEQYLLALEAALTAVAIEPVRESANRTVMEVHIAEGNTACAIKQYQRYRCTLQRELGVTPSQQMDRLLHPLVTR